MRKRKFEKEFSLINLSQATRMSSTRTMFDLYSVNLYYFEQYNALILPAGILYRPIFDLEYPTYLNYATIGVYLAHEIWHFIEKEIFKNIPDDEFYSHPYVKHLQCLQTNYQKYVTHKYGDIQIGE
jgi:hypothetical protein